MKVTKMTLQQYREALDAYGTYFLDDMKQLKADYAKDRLLVNGSIMRYTDITGMSVSNNKYLAVEVNHGDLFLLPLRRDVRYRVFRSPKSAILNKISYLLVLCQKIFTCKSGVC